MITAPGYPWGFWAGGDYDLIAKGKERFVKKTEKLRAHANKLGIKLCHEILPGTAAMCADDFNTLVEICGGDACLAVNADPSHFWEGETWEQRFLKVGSRIYAAHVKNFVIRPGFPLRAMQPNWPRRAMQFMIATASCKARRARRSSSRRRARTRISITAPPMASAT